MKLMLKIMKMKIGILSPKEDNNNIFKLVKKERKNKLKIDFNKN